MHTSLHPSEDPPNHAAAGIPSIAVIVDAWHCGVGILSAMNSCRTIAGCNGAWAQLLPEMPRSASATMITLLIGRGL